MLSSSHITIKQHYLLSLVELALSEQSTTFLSVVNIFEIRLELQKKSLMVKNVSRLAISAPISEAVFLSASCSFCFVVLALF